MDLEEVRQLENPINKFYDNDKYMTYTIDPTPDGREFADINYDFDDKGLYYVLVETYQSDHNSSTALENVVKNYFNNRYEKNTLSDNGYKLWDSVDSLSGNHHQIGLKEITIYDNAGVYIEFYVIE